jgi:glucan biosynthesis protein C
MPQRLHHLDAARAVLLLLGIPFHVGTTATMILSPGFPAWMANPVLGVGLSFIHSFRMSAFFILAGYFSGMASARRGRSAWLADRMMRVALPLVASVASLAVVQYHLKVMLSAAWAPGLYGWPLAFEHLWFLIVLLGFIFTYALRPARRLVPDPCGARCSGSIPARRPAPARPGDLGRRAGLGGTGAGPARQRSGVRAGTAAALPAISAGLRDRRAGLAAEAGQQPVRVHRALAAVGRAPLMIGHFLLDPLVRPHLGWDADPTAPLRVLDGALACALTYAMALIVFRLLAHLFDKPSRAVSFLVDGAMTIYLFHMIVAMLVILAMAHLGAADWPFPTMQWMALSALVLGLSVLVFLVVRRVPAGGGVWRAARLALRAASRAEWVAIRARTAKGHLSCARIAAGNGRKPEGPRNPADKPAIG